MSTEPQTSNIKTKTPKSRIYIEEAKEEVTKSIDISPSKSKVILPPIKNKSIKFDEAMEERSFEKMKVPPLTSIKNKSIKIADSKKFNIVGEINSKTHFTELFQKSSCCPQALLLNVKGGLSHMLETSIGLKCEECYPYTRALELLQNANGPKTCECSPYMFIFVDFEDPTLDMQVFIEKVRKISS